MPLVWKWTCSGVWQIKLRHFRSKSPDTVTRTSYTLFRTKSAFCPNITNAPNNTTEYRKEYRKVEQDIIKMNNQPFHMSINLTTNEKVALNELINDKDIVIKPVVKNWAIWVQDAAR